MWQKEQLFLVFRSFFGGVGVVDGETIAKVDERDEEELFVPLRELFKLLGV